MFIEPVKNKNNIKNIESFYSATAGETENCQSKIDEMNEKNRIKFNSCIDDKNEIKTKFSEQDSTNRMELSKCMNDKLSVQTLLDTKSTESTNYKQNYAGCNESLSKLNTE